MKKVIHTLNISDNKMLHALALAWTVAQENFDDGIKSAKTDFPDPDNCPDELRATLTAMRALVENLAGQFWSAIDNKLPDEYIDNVKACNPALGKINVYDEKHDCDNCDSDDSVGNLDDILSSIEGLESSDDFVDRLADLKKSIRNKKGGIA